MNKKIVTFLSLILMITITGCSTKANMDSTIPATTIPFTTTPALSEESADYEEYPFHDIEAFDYESVAAESPYQKLEKIIDGNAIVFSTTDLHMIVDFLNNLEMKKWKSIESLPDNINILCTIIRYTHPKEESGKEMTEQIRYYLTQNEDHYYLSGVTTQNSPSGYEEQTLYYLIPDTVGTYLTNLD